MGMFSFLKAPETIDKLIGAAIKSGDALVFTEEEKAEFHKEAQKIHLKHIELTAGENNATSVARRWFATIVTIPFVFLTVGSGIFHALGHAEIAQHWQALAMEDYSTLVLMVGVFYLGTHGIKALKN